MSKLIESLKASARGLSQKTGPGTSGNDIKRTNYETTQQQLADIYFSGPEKLRKSDEPLVIKVIERPKPASLVPWIMTFVAFLSLLFALFSTKRVFIDIKVVDEKHPSYPTGLRAEPTEPWSATRPGQTQGAAYRYGDKLPLQDFVFDGAAKLQSSRERNLLTLVNSSVAPFARASFNFKAPVNLRSSKIVFYAKGGQGGENIAFSLKDKDNQSAFSKGRVYPFPGLLTTDWQLAEIPLLNTDAKFDDQNVTGLRFDVGSKDTENKPGDTVFIRDLQIVPM